MLCLRVKGRDFRELWIWWSLIKREDFLSKVVKSKACVLHCAQRWGQPLTQLKWLSKHIIIMTWQTSRSSRWLQLHELFKWQKSDYCLSWWLLFNKSTHITYQRDAHQKLHIVQKTVMKTVFKGESSWTMGHLLLWQWSETASDCKIFLQIGHTLVCLLRASNRSWLGSLITANLRLDTLGPLAIENQ